MKKHYCPEHIKELFDTEELASKQGRMKFLEWAEELVPQLRRGDLIEMPEVDDDNTWWEYEPNN